MPTALNPYVWDLYLNSLGGELAVTYFQGLKDYTANAAFEDPLQGVMTWMASHVENSGTIWEDEPMDKETIAYIGAVRRYAQARPVSTPEEVQHLLTSLVTSGEVRVSQDSEEVLDLDLALEDVQLVTLALHLAHPDVFVPYGYKGQHHLLLRISNTFGIPLPPVAAKNDHLGRWLYYAHFSAAFQDFRRAQGMSVPELLAFLNHFALEYVLTSDDAELPEPRHTWLLVGGGEEEGDLGDLEAMTETDEVRWQGSLDMRRGDVCVMYVRSPVSAVHSLCRVVEDAYEDPFFHYKHSVQIGRFQKVPRIPFRELAAAPAMAQSQHIRRNLQGTSGQLLSRGEYEDILSLLARKGFDQETAPRLSDEAEVDLTNLANERDVETQLVEPLLERLDLLPNRDWVRQLPVRMGRGERNYPDYAIGVTGTAPEERARALIEVKYRAPGERAWREAFLQAKSYALRLRVKALIVAAAEGVRYHPMVGDDFLFEEARRFSWSDLREGPALLELRRALT